VIKKTSKTGETPDVVRRTVLRGLTVALPAAASGVALGLGGCAQGQTNVAGHGRQQPADASAAQATELSATDAVRMIRNGEMRAEAYASHLLTQYGRHKDLNTVTWIDEARVLESARAIDRARSQGKPLGPLGGLPFIAKDNIDTIGFPTSAGTSGLKTNFPQSNAPVVDLLLKSGAILLAKTNMHELAAGGTSSNPTFGVVKNPYDRTRVVGGSSGGTAAAIAARITPAGLGTDTSGSVRIPAAFCGVAALRPTSIDPKLYSDQGVVPLSLYLDTIGPIGRTVSDVALLHAAIRATAMPSAQPLKGVRIGIARKPFWEDLEPEVARLCEDATSKLKAAGVTFVDLDFSKLAAETVTLQRTLVISSIRDDLGNYLAGRNHKIASEEVLTKITSADVRALYKASAGSTVKAETVRELKEMQRPRLREQFEEMLRAHQVTAVMFPTEPLVAPTINPRGDSLTDEIMLNGRLVNAGGAITRNTRFAAGLGVPALSVPVGLTAAGLPVGFELDSRAGSDSQLLALGMAIELVIGRIPAPRGV
jgi:Asp-tRNA(Asn)/Glu-tRNA(Gln) amidotransferase A subunit family amidase